jgi:DNA-3-methyladenine glycosylase I
VSAAYCLAAPGNPLHGPYHDTEYGFPARDDAVLFERLVLEINQAGLSWATMLRKRDAFRSAFAGYAVDKVAAFGPADFDRLMADAGIIRNRLKIAAVIDNAARIQELRRSHGSFAAWLDAHHPRPLPEWVKLFRQTFRFTGGEIVNEFLMSLGYLPGAHEKTCPVYAAVTELSLPWIAVREGDQGNPSSQIDAGSLPGYTDAQGDESSS